jgi:hypothetical protein
MQLEGKSSIENAKARPSHGNERTVTRLEASYFLNSINANHTRCDGLGTVTELCLKTTPKQKQTIKLSCVDPKDMMIALFFDKVHSQV